MAKTIKYVVVALVILMLVAASCDASFFGKKRFGLVKPKFFVKPKLGPVKLGGFAKPKFFGKKKFFKKKLLFG